MIVKRINDRARSHPSDVAVICNGRELTYAAFARSIERTRTFLARSNLPLEKTAIVLQTPGIQTWLCVLALRALGLNTLCIQSPEQIASLKQKDVACLVVAEADSVKLGNHLAQAIQVLTVPEAIFSNDSDDPVPEPNDAPQFGGHILLTSGTTGDYKKVLLDGANEDRRNAARALAYSLTKNVVYHALYYGLWTTIGFRVSSAVWHVGGCVIIDYRRALYWRFFDHEVFSILTPTMLKQLVESTDGGAESIAKNSELMITSGFLPIDLARTVIRRLTKNIGISYGSTELATPALLSHSSADDELCWLTPLNRMVRIVDENGDDCPTGREGELHIQLQDTDCGSYLDDPVASARVFRNGFFCPGDMAVGRADGRVRILGRTTDVLQLQGNKVAAAPYEQALQRALKVDEVCLFSGLNRIGEEELAVAIESDRALPQSSVDRITEAFPGFERVRVAYFKEFPRVATGTGKIARKVLRNWIFD